MLLSLAKRHAHARRTIMHFQCLQCHQCRAGRHDHDGPQSIRPPAGSLSTDMVEHMARRLGDVPPREANLRVQQSKGGDWEIASDASSCTLRIKEHTREEVLAVLHAYRIRSSI